MGTKMKTKEILGHKIKFKQGLLTFALLATLTGFTSIAGATYTLPADRSVTWQGNVGVKGDIPVRTTIYTTLSPSGGDDTAAIKTAITNCPAGQVVKLSAGSFLISSPINVKSGITLRGSGNGVTTIKGAIGMSGAYVIGFNSSNVYEGTSYTISAGLTKGSTSISTLSPHGWSPGDIIRIDQLNNPTADPPVNSTGYNGTCTWCGRSSGTRSLGQFVKIVNVPTSTTATLEIPLYWNYDASLTPQGVKINGITSNAGMEDLTIDNNLSASANQANDGATIAMYGASNCWLNNVEGIGSWVQMIRMLRTYRNTIIKCKFHEPIGGIYGPGRAYGITTNAASANLFENNQFYHLFFAFTGNGTFSGNVFSYNYMTALSYSPAGWQVGAIEFHGAHAMMNLIEGNYSNGRLVADNVWGSSSHNTFFRNRNTLATGTTGGNFNIELETNQNYYNFVGNVIGTLGHESYYTLENLNITTAYKSIYRLGYTSDGDGTSTGNDPQVSATILRHGNWDSVTNGPVWNGGDDRVLPASFYLTSKPSWWNNLQWPAIGPDVSPMYPATGPIGSGTPWGSKAITSAPALSPPTGLKVM